MINLFLKAKHWHLFLLTFALPLIIQFYLMGTMLTSVIANQGAPDPAVFSDFLSIVAIISFFVAFVTFGWKWSVAIGLQKFIPENVTMKVTKFKVFFFLPLLYILTIFSIVAIFITSMLNDPNTFLEGDSGFIFSSFFIVIPTHLFAMFCIFYVMYFVAKTIKTVELQREVSFSDCVGEFFLIWFNFIGFWILQPKINKFCEEGNPETLE